LPAKTSNKINSHLGLHTSEGGLKMEELRQSLLKATRNDVAWVIIKDNSDIFGSNASYDALAMAGGAKFILNARSLKHFLKYEGYSFNIGNDQFNNIKSFLDFISKELAK